MTEHSSDQIGASQGALIAGGAFVVLIGLFSANPTSRSGLLLIAIVAITAHIALLPTVANAAAAAWSRPAGYGWIAADVVLNGATLNGVDASVVMPLRLGGHFLAALWIGSAASRGRGVVRGLGLLLALLLAAHALAARWAPDWAIYPPFTLMPVWLIALGWRLRHPHVAPAG